MTEIYARVDSESFMILMWERASRECHGKSDARNHLNYNPIDVVNYKVISTLTLTW